jgi:hypothetical protein
MQGTTRRLFCWGKIAYEDVYGGSWETNFRFNYTFYRGDDQSFKVSGWVYGRHNESIWLPGDSSSRGSIAGSLAEPDTRLKQHL